MNIGSADRVKREFGPKTGVLDSFTGSGSTQDFDSALDESEKRRLLAEHRAAAAVGE
jgi:hypothetical protein